MKKYVVPFLHASIILFVFVSPWIVPWKIILLIFILDHLQLVLFGNCVLNLWQFENKEETFWLHYVKKIFPQTNTKYLNLFTDWVLQAGVVVVAILIQN